MKRLFKFSLMAMALLGILVPEGAMAWWNTGYRWPGGGIHRNYHGYNHYCPVRKVCFHHRGHIRCNHQRVCY